MVLTNNERDKLHHAMVEYLASHNLNEAAEALKSSLAGCAHFDDKDSALERKWSIVLRLTRKNQELEEKVKHLENEIRDLRDPTKSGSSGGAGGGGNKMADLPLAPAEPSIFSFSGHRDTLTAVSLHPHEPLGFSSSEDGTIRVWDLETRRHVKTLRNHTDSVAAVAVEPKEGKLLASAGKDLTVKVFDLNSDEFDCISTLHHDDSVTAVAWDPQTFNHLVSSTRSGQICVWDAARAAQVLSINHGTWIHTIDVAGGQIVIGDHAESVALYSMTTKQAVRTFNDHENVVDVVCFSNEKADAIFIENHGTPDQKAFLKELERRKEQKKIAAELNGTSSAAGQLEVYQPRFVVSGGRDKNVIMRDVTSGAIALKLETHENWVQGAAFTSSGRHLVTCADDGTLVVFDLTTKRVARKIEAHEHFVTCMSLHPLGKPLLLTGSADTTVKMWPCK